MKIGYFADGPWGQNTLIKLLKDSSISIGFVCVRNDNRDPILMELAQQNGIDVLYHPNINSAEFLTILSHYQVDLFVSMSFNQIFKHTIINFPPLKTINCHAGKLPFYRGRNILNWALINDEKEFGITVHYMDEGIDTGDIILQRVYPISDMDTYETLLMRAHTACADILFDAIKKIQSGCAGRIMQTTIHPVGFYCGMRVAGDEQLDWNNSSRDIFNFVRAICSPGPQARSYIGDAEIKINAVSMVENAPHYKNTIGQVIGKTPSGFLVKTKDTFVEVTEYTFDGKVRIGDRLL
ncbi:methionyl-tRNA formyltransferase [Oscillospiraceae bacterium PP1C4]